eukprot:7823397-Alexandrium_andersonii.AAC.1
MVGKCARVAQVVPEARPFVHGLYAALAGAVQADREAGRRNAPPGCAAVVRFAPAAVWFRTLVTGV